MSQISEKVTQRLERAKVIPRTVTLKIKFNDFESITRSKTRLASIQSHRETMQVMEELLEEFKPPPKGIRLLGISFSNFIEEGVQLTFDF